MKTEISTFDGTADEWNRLLVESGPYSFYQSYGWGEIKKGLGWKVLRVIFSNPETKERLFCQVLYRKKFKIGIAWIPGALSGSFRVFNAHLLQKKLDCILLHSRFAWDEVAFPQTHTLALKDPLVYLNTGRSVTLDLKKSKDEMLQSMSQNWRHNYQRAVKKKLIAQEWKNWTADQVGSMVSALEDKKKFDLQLSPLYYELVFKNLHKEILMLQIKDEHGEVVAIRGATIMGNQALDFFAATAGQGRSLYASYFGLVSLADALREAGCVSYDLGGMDENKNPGVANFKKGTGGTLTVYAGEKELGNSLLLRLLFNLMLKLKS